MNNIPTPLASDPAEGKGILSIMYRHNGVTNEAVVAFSLDQIDLVQPMFACVISDAVARVRECVELDQAWEQFHAVMSPTGEPK